MPHRIKGQSPSRYRPSVGRRNLKLESIRQSPGTGWNYNRNNLVTLLRGFRSAPAGSGTLGPNVPPWGAPRNRIPLQTLIYNARKKYASAKTQAAKNAVQRICTEPRTGSQHAPPKTCSEPRGT